MPDCRSEPLSSSAPRPDSAAMPAARRLTAPRTRTAAITPKVKIAVARNTSTASISAEPSANTPATISEAESMARILKRSDLEVDQPVHDEVADHHPAAGERQRLLGDVLGPDARVEFRRHDLNHREDGDRQRREDQRGSARFRGQRANLAAHLESLANDGRQVLENLAEIAAGRSLDPDRGDE